MKNISLGTAMTRKQSSNITGGFLPGTCYWYDCYNNGEWNCTARVQQGQSPLTRCKSCCPTTSAVATGATTVCKQPFCLF